MSLLLCYASFFRTLFVRRCPVGVFFSFLFLFFPPGFCFPHLFLIQSLLRDPTFGAQRDAWWLAAGTQIRWSSKKGLRGLQVILVLGAEYRVQNTPCRIEDDTLKISVYLYWLHVWKGIANQQVYSNPAAMRLWHHWSSPNNLKRKSKMTSNSSLHPLSMDFFSPRVQSILCPSSDTSQMSPLPPLRRPLSLAVAF